MLRLYGVYAISSANANTIQNNTIQHNGIHGIYIKTSGNTIQQNQVADNGSSIAGVSNGSGIAFLGDSTAPATDDALPPGKQSTDVSGTPELLDRPTLTSALTNNQVNQNMIVRNAEHGIEIKGASGTLVSANIVEGNGLYGIYMANGTLTTQVLNNTFAGNRGYGIRTNGSDTRRNTWSKNAVFNNRLGGIVNSSGANGGIHAPSIQQKIVKLNVCDVAGATIPGGVVEIFSDRSGQGRYFEASITADGTGAFVFSANRACAENRINAVVIDSAGNASSFATNVGVNNIVLPLIIR